MYIDDRHRPQQSTWNYGLCSCGGEDGLCTCCITWLLPCVTFGQIAEVVDEGNSSCVVLGMLYGLAMMIQCHWLSSCLYRQKLRSKFGLPGDACGDCCLHFCCEPCALCQEHAELKSRGYDPSKGWKIRPPNAPPMHTMPPTMIR